jgi:hypothetical protein
VWPTRTNSTARARRRTRPRPIGLVLTSAFSMCRVRTVRPVHNSNCRRPHRARYPASSAARCHGQGPTAQTSKGIRRLGGASNDLVCGMGIVGMSILLAWAPCWHEHILGISTLFGPCTKYCLTLYEVPSVRDEPHRISDESDRSLNSTYRTRFLLRELIALRQTTHVRGSCVWSLRYIARQLYDAQHEKVPIGIIQSDVPGTPIQKWTSAAGIADCFKGPAANATAADASVLYNAMIHPFFRVGDYTFELILRDISI